MQQALTFRFHLIDAINTACHPKENLRHIFITRYNLYEQSLSSNQLAELTGRFQQTNP